jgi:hypothetical protein
MALFATDADAPKADNFKSRPVDDEGIPRLLDRGQIAKAGKVEPLWDHAKWVEDASKAVVDGTREDKPRRRRGTVETVQAVSPRVRCMIIRRIHAQSSTQVRHPCPQGLNFLLPRWVCLVCPRQRLKLSPRGALSTDEGDKHTADHTSPTEGRRRRASRGQQSGQMTREETGAVRLRLSPDVAREGRTDDAFETEPAERGSGRRRRRSSARETDNLRYAPNRTHLI